MKKLKDYLSSMPQMERDALATRCGTTPAYLRNIAYGYRQAGERLAAVLEKESGGAVTRKDFFPDDWQVIWPELADKEATV